MRGSTFVDDELALCLAQASHVHHSDIIACPHGMLEGVRMLHGCPVQVHSALRTCS